MQSCRPEPAAGRGSQHEHRRDRRRGRSQPRAWFTAVSLVEKRCATAVFQTKLEAIDAGTRRRPTRHRAGRRGTAPVRRGHHRRRSSLPIDPDLMRDDAQSYARDAEPARQVSTFCGGL